MSDDMKRTHTGRVIAALVAMFTGCLAAAAQGPVHTPLKVTYIYMSGGSAIYVSFQPGAMPGCYGNAGGYLFNSNQHFKEIYAQLLLMAANGGMRAAVIYTQNTPTNNWSDCTIDGINLLPDT
jgi:hypothetical protein